MSKIKLTLPMGDTVYTGKQINFTAPCGCSSTEAIEINGETYDIVDANGVSLSRAAGVWAAGSIISVVLDVDKHRAYLNGKSGTTVIQEQNNGKALSFWVGTQEEYNNLAAHVDDCFYIITDDDTYEVITNEIAGMQEHLSQVDEKLAKAYRPWTTDNLVAISSAYSIGSYHLSDWTCLCEPHPTNSNDHTKKTVTKYFKAKNFGTLTMQYSPKQTWAHYDSSANDMQHSGSFTADISVNGKIVKTITGEADIGTSNAEVVGDTERFGIEVNTGDIVSITITAYNYGRTRYVGYFPILAISLYANEDTAYKYDNYFLK